MQEDPVALGRAIIDANLYLVLGTADAEGRPWVSPVYFAHAGFDQFFWVSKPEAQHSRNLAQRPEISVVIFDSQVPISTGRAVYMSASAEELTGSERELAMDVFSRRSLQHGGHRWTVDDVQPPAQLPPYRAVASTHYVLDANDRRMPVSL
jgi:nitroimidazol reductase NimA-like FMN-containing flavoprotein (pyridoxamine 5'-phosphate oxidase superfamily)